MTVSLSNYLEADAATRALRRDVRDGLTASPKTLPPKWFYDARGSELFERITRLPEYYPTRAEREILADRSGEIARASGARTLVELGSGSSEKTRYLIDALTSLAAGEELRTEVSAKFRKEGMTQELAAAGLEWTHWWTDAQGRFALSLSVAR